MGKRYEFGDSQITIIGLLESEYQKQYNETLNNDDEEEPLELMSNDDSQSPTSMSFENSDDAQADVDADAQADVDSQADAQADPENVEPQLAEGKNDLDFELEPFKL